MAEFVYSKGYLVNDDLAWDVNEYLVGAEYVNDCVHWYGSGGAHYGAFATNADIVVVRLDTNTQLGWATLEGGFEKVTRCGDYLYAISKLDTTKIYRVQWSTMSGDSTPGGWSAYITAPGAYTFADVHGCTYDSGSHRVLAWTGDDGTTAKLWLRELPGSDVRELAFGENSTAGFFPAGDHDNTLYYAIGSRIHAIHRPHLIGSDPWVPDASVGAVADDFAGDTIDGRNWVSFPTAGATLTQDDGLDFVLSNSGPLREAPAYFLQSCPGDIGVRAKYTVLEEPTPVDDEYTEIIVGLVTLGGTTQYLHVRKRTASGVVNRMEVWHGGSVVYSHDSTSYTSYPWIAVDRFRDGDDIKIRISASNDSGDPVSWSTIHTYVDSSGDDMPLLPALSATSTCTVASELLRGRFEHFRARDVSCAHYRVRRTSPIYMTGLLAEEITAAAVSARSPSLADPRMFALVYGAVNAKTQVVRLDHGAYDGALARDAVVSNTIGTAASGAAIPILSTTQALRCVAVSDDSTSIVVGDSGGAQQVNVSDIVHDTSVALLRRYTTEWDHAQPLVDTPVWCIDWRGDSFIYGCRSDADETNPDYWGYGYGYAGHVDGGGAGYIVPDFDAPVGTFAFAQGTLDGEDRVLTSAYQPDPVPADYLHAHVERRTSGGAWYRLKTTGWVEYTGAWDHSTDVIFLDGSTPTDAYMAVQDTTVSTARYEYRWIYHDEAGNQGELEAVTRYGNFVEYRGTPVITSVSINGGASPVTSRGVTVTVAAHSGTTSGSAAGKVFQVRIWNSDESESDAEWRDFPVAATTGDFPFVLSSGGGTKTIHVRARHTSGVTSASVSASTTLNEGTITTVSTDWEAGMLIHGPETTSGKTFTCDWLSADGGTLTSNPAASTTYPLSLLTQDDVDAQWLSGIGDGGSRFGNETVPTPGYRLFTSTLVFDLSTAKNIGFFAALNTNFADIAAQPGVTSVGATLHGYTVYPGTPAYTAQLGSQIDNGWPFVVHRPGVSYRYWVLQLTMLRADGSFLGADQPGWKIGRIVLNESAYCWQPVESGVNFDRDWEDSLRDTSEVQDTVGGGRRVVENAKKGRVRWDYRFLSQEDHTALATIYERHGVRRPVVALADPINVGTGATVKYATKPTLVYGYLPDDFSRTNHVNGRGSTDIDVTGWRG